MPHSNEVRTPVIADADAETLLKASQGAAQLLEDLLALSRTDNPLLAEISFDLLAQIAPAEKKLRRLAALGGAQ